MSGMQITPTALSDQSHDLYEAVTISLGLEGDDNSLAARRVWMKIS